MEDMLNNLIAAAGGIAGIVAFVMLAADKIAKITPTKTDDKALQWVRKIARAIAVDVKDNPGK